jgi:alpha-L-rhamnosidase
VKLTDLRVEHCREPLGLWTSRPRFSWTLTTSRSNVRQDSYELEVRRESGTGTLWSSGPVAGGQSVLVPYDGPELESSTRYVWRVRVAAGPEVSPWTESGFETSLLRRSDWCADFVEPRQEPVTPDGLRRVGGEWVPPPTEGPPEQRLHPAKYLRQALRLRARPARARLYATACGVYDVEINGLSVGDQVLAPGYESYDKQLSFQTYDVTDALTEGDNVLGVVLGDGWYAGRIDFTGTSAQYGDRLRAGWQLVVRYDEGPEDVFTSDASVRSSADGPIRYSDIFIGERYDATVDWSGWSSPGFDDSRWTPVTTVPAPAVLVPFLGEPVRRVMHVRPQALLQTPDGDLVADFGQVLAGRVRLRVRGPRGTVVMLEHSEVLDADGNFFINIAGFNKDQMDHYVLAGSSGADAEEWEPLFTFHGFRYVRIIGYPGKPALDDLLAVVVASDLEPAGTFTCSDPRISQLHSNVVWSQRGNFLAIPTDCPQRERVGWTGDLQVFAAAATRNAMVVPFLRRWLTTLRADQSPDGLVPVIVPTPPFLAALSGTSPDDPLLSITAAAGWGDAVVLVPWVLYERYGDRLVLDENYGAMKAWVDRQIRVARDDLPARLRGTALTEAERRRQRYLWNSERNFGDWLAPSVTAQDPSLEHMLAVAERTGELIGAMCHGHSAELLGRIAAVLGHDDDAARYLEQARAVRRAFAAEYLDDDGVLTIATQGTYVLALALGCIPESQQPAAVDQLVALIHAAGDHLDTGFLSVPHILGVLSAHGHAALARTLLWQSRPPSWLYAVDRGATTIWENWTAIRPNGQVEAASFNHYAFGSVDEWLYGHLAGLQPVAPGFVTSRIAPDLEAPLDWVAASNETPYGTLAVRWERDRDDDRLVRIRLTVPANTSSSLVFPRGAQVLDVRDGDGEPAGTALDRIGSGCLTVAVRLGPASP